MILFYLFSATVKAAGFLLPLLLNIGTGILSSGLMKGISNSTNSPSNLSNSSNTISPNLTPTSMANINSSQFYPRQGNFPASYNSYPPYNGYYMQQAPKAPYYGNSWSNFSKFRRF